MGASLSAGGPAGRRSRRALQQCRACPPTARSARPSVSRRRTSSSTAAAWASLAARGPTSPLTADEVDTAARPRRRRSTSTRSQQVYLPLSRLLSLRVAGRRPAAPQAGGVPPAAAAAAYAVRDRARRLRRRRQVHDRPRAAAAARPLARAPPRRAGHHRRLPLPQRRARAPRHPAPQGLPGVLRPPGAAAVRHRRSSPAATRSTAPIYSHLVYDVVPGRAGRGQAARHRHHRGPQRPPAGAGARGRPHRADA